MTQRHTVSKAGSIGWSSLRRVFRSEWVKLALIVMLALYITIIPRQDYPLPVHVDEWFHMALSEAVATSGGTDQLENPFFGGPPVWNQNFELGFHVLSLVIRDVTGIPMIDIVTFFPGLFFVGTVLSVHILARRLGFGWEAAFFVSLLPTTVGILGPAFYVPAALGLLYIPLSMFIVFYLRTKGAYVLLFLVSAFLVSMHAGTEINLIVMMVPFLVLGLLTEFRRSLAVALVLVAPIVLLFPWVWDMVVQEGGTLLEITDTINRFVQIPRLLATFGVLPAVLSVTGVFYLSLRGKREGLGLAGGLAIILGLLAVFYSTHYGINTLYQRGLTHAMLLMSITAGAGLSLVNNWKLPLRLDRVPVLPLVVANLGRILCLTLVVLVLADVIPVREREGYYHMISRDDYRSFSWIRDNLDPANEVAILDPWKATAFTAVTGMKVHTRIHMNPTKVDRAVYAFLNNLSQDTDFLIENGIFLVYHQGEVSNPDLSRIRKDVYLLDID